MSTPTEADRPRAFLVDRMRAIDRAVTRQIALALPPTVAERVSTPHMRLMAEVPPRGIRPSELADRLGVTRSAVSQLVDYLERLGLLERTADATDRRAALVRQTASASSAQRVARQTIARIEQSWSDRLGAEAFAVLEQALEELRRWSLEQEPAEP